MIGHFTILGGLSDYFHQYHFIAVDVQRLGLDQIIAHVLLDRYTSGVFAVEFEFQ